MKSIKLERHTLNDPFSTESLLRHQNAPHLSNMESMSGSRMMTKPIAILKAAIPTIFLITLVPHTFLTWLFWKLATLWAPSWIYQKGDDLIFGIYQLVILFFFENVLGTEIILYGDANDALKKKERVLYLANHQSDFDFIVVDMLAARQGSINQVRYVIKDTVQLVPIYGQYLYQHGCIYVNRSKFNQGKMMRALKYLRSPKIDAITCFSFGFFNSLYNQNKSWMVVFPEGTRYNPNSTSVLERNKQLAESQGMSPFKHLLMPKSRGVTLCLSELRHHFDAIYDVTVIYEGTRDEKSNQRIRTPNIFELCGLSKTKLHIHLNRITLESVPLQEHDIKSWLINNYAHKDKMVDAYYGQGDTISKGKSKLWGPGTPSPLDKWKTVSAVVLHCIPLILFILYDSGSHLYWGTFAYGTVGSYIWLALRSVA